MTRRYLIIPVVVEQPDDSIAYQGPELAAALARRLHQMDLGVVSAQPAEVTVSADSDDRLVSSWVKVLFTDTPTVLVDEQVLNVGDVIADENIGGPPIENPDFEIDTTGWTGGQLTIGDVG